MEESERIRALRRFADWITSGEFQPVFLEVRESHTADACETLEKSLVELTQSNPEECSVAMEAIFEDIMGAPCEPDDEKPVDAYLAEDGRHEPARVKTYLKAVRDSERSLFEVVDVERGLAVTVEDWFEDRARIRVLAPEQSNELARGDMICARIIKTRGHLFFTGPVMAYDDEAGRELTQALEQTMKDALKTERKIAKKEHRRPLDEAEFGSALRSFLRPQLTNAWLIAQISLALPDDADGLPGISFFTLSFKIAHGYREGVENRMDKSGAFERSPDGSPSWRWLESDNPDSADSSVEIVGDMVVWETFSMDGATSGRKKLMKLLGPAVGPPLVVERSPQEALNSASEIALMQARSEGVTDEEWRQETVENMDAVYRAILDEPNDFLDGLSPREAVRTKKGRKQTAKLLNFIEGSEIACPKPIGYDFTWLWEELGIADLRAPR